MNQPIRIPLALLGCSALLAAGACTRTSDGSVVVKAPPSLSFAVPSYLRAGDQDTEIRMADAFPPAPAEPAPSGTPRKTLPTVKAWKVGGVQAPFKRADATAPLSCRDETGDGGRVKVVCE